MRYRLYYHNGIHYSHAVLRQGLNTLLSCYKDNYFDEEGLPLEVRRSV
jgi:hypothetical protein